MPGVERPKICFVVTSKLVVKFFLVNIINGLTDKYDVILIVSNDQDDNIDLSELRAEIVYITIERKISLLRDLWGLLLLLWFFVSVRPAVVHSMTPKAGLLAMLASFIARVPVRVHIFTGQVWASRKGFMRYLLKTMDKMISVVATNLLADSNSQRLFLINQQVVSAEKISVLANGSVCGVDTGRFKPSILYRSKIREKLGIDENTYLFLFLGRLNRDKGVLDLGRAFAQLAERYQGIHLAMVGPDEDEITEVFHSLYFSALDRISFVDYTPTPHQYMAAADVLCLPSYREGFGSVIIEAASTGIPSIASDIYGVVDALVDGVTGVLFPPGDVAALAQKMEFFIKDPGKGKDMGRMARERAKNEFSRQILEDAWREYYRHLLEPA